MSASGLDTRGIVRVLALAGVREGREGAARGPFTVGDADAAAGATRIFALRQLATDGGKYKYRFERRGAVFIAKNVVLIAKRRSRNRRVDRPSKGGAA